MYIVRYFLMLNNEAILPTVHVYVAEIKNSIFTLKRKI